MFNLGNYIVIIHNPKEFIHRIRKYCKAQNIVPNCFPVSYYNENIEEGLLTPFDKRDYYAYQKETRIYIYNKNLKDRLILKIGSIKDIATISKCSKI